MNRPTLAALAFAAAAVSMPAAAQFRNADAAIKYRQGAMSIQGNHLARVFAMANGQVPFDAKVAQENIEVIALLNSRVQFSAFIEGSDKGRNRAPHAAWWRSSFRSWSPPRGRSLPCWPRACRRRAAGRSVVAPMRIVRTVPLPRGGCTLMLFTSCGLASSSASVTLPTVTGSAAATRRARRRSAFLVERLGHVEVDARVVGRDRAAIDRLRHQVAQQVRGGVKAHQALAARGVDAGCDRIALLYF
jgi:hypothetical protein